MYIYIIYDIWYKVLVLVRYKVYLVNIYNIYNAIYMMLYIYIYVVYIYIYIYIYMLQIFRRNKNSKIYD